MTEYEEFEKLIKKARVKYYKKHFIGKSIEKALYETIKEIILDLTATTAKLNLLIECLCILRKEKSYFSKLHYEQQRNVKMSIITLKFIRKDLNNIIVPIAEGLYEE